MNGNLKRALMVIYSSPDEKTWTPVLPQYIPEWVLQADVLGTMIEGNIAQHNDGGLWYRAEAVLSDAERARIEAAAQKRARRATRNLLQLPADRALVIETSELKH